MAKQYLLFGSEEPQETQKYSGKIEAPVYEPKHEKPHVLTLCDETKTKALIREVEASDLPDEEKRVLIAAAHRHTVFHYERLADYYAHASPEMQRLMERSALVIIDFDSAIENGFVKLCEDIRSQYLEEYASNGDAS